MIVKNETTDARTGVTVAEVIDLDARTVTIEIDGRPQGPPRQFTQHENDLADLDAAFKTAEVNRRAIYEQVALALDANSAYVGIINPSNAQVAAQVKALTRQVSKLIRLSVGRLDATG